MARQYGHEKVNLFSTLSLIAESDPRSYGELLFLIAQISGCSERAAKDALTVLKRAGYVTPLKDASDRRRRCYALSDQGRRVLEHRYGDVLLRFVRKLLTSCPSRRGLQRQRSLIEHGELEEKLEDVERLLLDFGAGSDSFHPVMNPVGSFESSRSLAELFLDEPPRQPRESSARSDHDRNGNVQVEVATIIGPRCKVCQSEHRREIDIMLATGWPQASVVRHWNGYLGRDYFTRKNISWHAQRHLSDADPAIRRLVERCAARSARLLECNSAPRSSKAPSPLAEAAAVIARSGFAATIAGLVVPEPKEMLAALKLLGEFEAETFTREKNEMEREMRAFVRAVKAVVPEELQTQIFAEYERRLDESAPDATARVPN